MRKFLEKNGFEILNIKPQCTPHVFYFTVEDFWGRFFNYFYRLTNRTILKKIITILNDVMLVLVRKIGIADWVVPAIDGQFLIIAKRKK